MIEAAPITGKHGSAEDFAAAEPWASNKLSEMGIKGIQYDDAMSRGAEGGTKNYVIFDDSLISIAKKYGVAAPLASAIAAGTMTPQKAMAEQAVNNRLYGIGADVVPPMNISPSILQPTNLRINDTISPNESISVNLANLIALADRSTKGSPGNWVIPTGLGDFLRNISIGKKNKTLDYGVAAADILPF